MIAIWPIASVSSEGSSPARLNSIRRPSPSASPGNVRGAMKAASAPRAQMPLRRAIASAAATASRVAATVAWTATRTLFSKATTISGELVASTPYQRSEKPSGGNRSVIPAVNEVMRTITVGAINSVSATAATPPNTSANDQRSRRERQGSTARGTDISGGITMPRRGAPRQTKPQDHEQHRDQQDHRERRGERPVVRLNRLLVEMKGHEDQAAAADQGLRDERADRTDEHQHRAGDQPGQAERQHHGAEAAPARPTERLRGIQQGRIDALERGDQRQGHQRQLDLRQRHHHGPVAVEQRQRRLHQAELEQG